MPAPDIPAPAVPSTPAAPSIPHVAASRSAPSAPIVSSAPVVPSMADVPSAPIVPSISPVSSAPAAPAAPPNAAAVAAPAPRTPVAQSIPTPDIDALLAAFMKGARVKDMAAPVRLTPALMELIGSIAYHATAGAMELIAARQITKREIRAEVTMIVADDNNPLKFLPTPEAAIMQMLGPRMPGFMKGGEAMRDAFDDLRAHEVGVIAGMRAALADVLQRFDPALLQKRLGESGLLDALVPGARRARLWDLFEASFAQLYREANDDFQSLFGEAFTKAYEEQIELDRARRRQP
jgi:FHA domain-containing protein